MLKKLQKIILPKQREINRGLQLIQGGLVFVWAMVWWQVWLEPMTAVEYGQVGKMFGVVSLVLFCATLIPGIFTRLQVWKTITLPVATLITPFRRNLGILMFVSAFVHMSLSTTLPQVALQLSLLPDLATATLSERLIAVSQAFPPSLRLFEQVAVIGWMILLPVWLTSNDVSQKKLGKWWKRVQRLTYVAIWFIMGHVALQSSLWAVVVGVVAILEVVSWLKVFVTSRQKK